MTPAVSVGRRIAVRWPAGTHPWRGGILTTLLFLVLFIAHITLCFRICEDDAFFLDLSWNLLTRGAYVNDTYGSLLGHDRMVASIPPVFPAMQTGAVLLYLKTNALIALKAETLAPVALGLPLLWWRLRSELPPVAVWMCFGVVASDGLLFNTVLSNRYEVWCMFICLALLVALEQAIAKPGLGRFCIFVATVAIASLSNWQLQPVVAAVLAGAMIYPGEDRKPNCRTRLLLVAAAAAAAVTGWILFASLPDWQSSFQRQLLGIADYYDQRTIPVNFVAAVWQRIKICAGNLVVGNTMRSCGSMVFLVLGGVISCYWWRERRSPAWSSPHTRRMLFYSLWWIAAMAPLVVLAYVGPRLVPVFLVSVVLLAGCGTMKILPKEHWVRIIGLAAVANYLGTCYLNYRDHSGDSRLIWVNYGLPVLLSYAAILFLKRSLSERALLTWLAILVVAGNILANVSYDSYKFSRGLSQAERDREAAVAGLNRLIEVRSPLALAGPIVIYGDAPYHYLIARALGAKWGREVRFRTFFQFFYYTHPSFGRAFVDTFDGAIVLLDAENRARLERFGPSGERMLALLADDYREVGRFTTSLGETAVLIRKSAPADSL